MRYPNFTMWRDGNGWECQIVLTEGSEPVCSFATDPRTLLETVLSSRGGYFGPVDVEPEQCDLDWSPCDEHEYDVWPDSDPQAGDMGG